MLKNLGQYNKTITALGIAITAFVTAIVASPAAGVLAAEWLILVTGITTTASVFAVENGSKEVAETVEIITDAVDELFPISFPV